MSPEWREKNAAAQRGKVMSSEAREKMSAAHKARWTRRKLLKEN